ncbi:hypothetical protein CIB48_g1876 [Xylaria polymorpha]|nr:hypothetical protein CIB48_g1876 [Xylaria polymorpha]
MRLGLSSTPYLGRTRGTERDVLAHYATKNSIPSAPAPQRAGLVDEAQAHDMDRRVRGRDHRGDHLRRGTEDAAGVPRHSSHSSQVFARKQEKKEVLEAPIEERIQTLETRRAHLVGQRRPLERKLEELRLRVQKEEDKAPPPPQQTTTTDGRS